MAVARQFRKLAAVAGAFSCSAAMPSSAFSAAPHYERIVITGQTVPGLTDIRYGASSGHARNNTGEILFPSEIYGPGVTAANNSAFSAGMLRAPLVIAREGDSAPSTPAGFAYGSLGSFALNDAGTIGYTIGLRENGGGDVLGAALYTTSTEGGTPTLLARATDVAPATPGWMYYSFGDVTVNNAGRIGYQARLSTSPGTFGPQALYLVGAGGAESHQLVALSNNAAPGTPAGVTYRDLGSLQVNSSSQVVFRARLQGSGVTSADDTAYFAGPADNPQLLIRAGSQAPGVETGAVFQDLTHRPNPRINSAGLVTFQAFLTGGGVTGANNVVLYVGTPEAPQLVARGGNQAPGLPMGVNYSGTGAAALNDAGQIAFAAGLEHGNGIGFTNDTVIYRGLPDALTPIVQEGGEAPGVPAGLSYAEFDWPEINETGQVFYHATLRGDGVTSADDRALFAYDPSIGDLLIVREGVPFDVGGGDLRTVTSILGYSATDAIGSGQDGPWSVSFALRFDDFTSGIFVATVPEPSGLVMIGSLAIAVCCHRPARRSTP